MINLVLKLMWSLVHAPATQICTTQSKKSIIVSIMWSLACFNNYLEPLIQGVPTSERIIATTVEDCGGLTKLYHNRRICSYAYVLLKVRVHSSQGSCIWLVSRCQLCFHNLNGCSSWWCLLLEQVTIFTA